MRRIGNKAEKIPDHNKGSNEGFPAEPAENILPDVMGQCIHRSGWQRICLLSLPAGSTGQYLQPGSVRDMDEKHTVKTFQMDVP